ncbi:MAG TPA: DUF4019 domain-containing protein [Pyrinomonadaceae bacterium]|nr:DUF4019 domain-containing protein [Pyrinomonadaceae bacterium]
MRARPVALGALLLLAFALSAACGVERKRSGLPPGAQDTIDSITSDIARGDYEKIYAEAADEWRSTAGADESRANLERIRNSLGGVLSRAQLSAQERAGDGDAQAGRTLIVGYNTKFERADAIETFTLVERSGRWLLARYAVNSNALK